MRPFCYVWLVIVLEDRNLAAGEVGGEVETLAGFESEEFDVGATCYPNCSDQPSCDVKRPCQTRLNEVSFVTRYRYDEGSAAAASRRGRITTGIDMIRDQVDTCRKTRSACKVASTSISTRRNRCSGLIRSYHSGRTAIGSTG